jgi:DNA-binding transcriptional regulator YiaG
MWLKCEKKQDGEHEMDSKEFSLIRHNLGKTQQQLAKLLCVSHKTIQSFEQGWRDVPASAERQLLFLLSMKRALTKNGGPCWEIRDCPVEWRENCAAWEFKAGHLCWYINGTFCEGRTRTGWKEKALICRQCEIFQKMLQGLA